MCLWRSLLTFDSIISFVPTTTTTHTSNAHTYNDPATTTTTMGKEDATQESILPGTLHTVAHSPQAFHHRPIPNPGVLSVINHLLRQLMQGEEMNRNSGIIPQVKSLSKDQADEASPSLGITSKRDSGALCLSQQKRTRQRSTPWRE